MRLSNDQDLYDQRPEKADYNYGNEYQDGAADRDWSSYTKTLTSFWS